jgi:hypothetical protein
VNLRVNNLKGQSWMLRRFRLDSETASNQENDRLRMERAEALSGAGEIRDAFELPPYGVALISLRRTK